MRKTYLNTVFLVLLAFCSQMMAQGQKNRMDPDSLIKKDSMNFAVLVLDFLSYTFEKASISYYPLCSGCDRDSLPFRIQYKPPGDFGDIRFYYTGNDELLFGATIIWDGAGSIYQPAKFRDAAEFPIGPVQVALPPSRQYFDNTLTPWPYSKENYIARAETAWTAIQNLQIVNEFASGPLRVGFYAWPPSVGVFCPFCAKWIIFLYSGNDFSEGIFETDKEPGISVYPVPAADRLFIDLQALAPGICRISLLNSLGSVVYDSPAQPAQNTSIDLADIESGFYYLIIRMPEKSQVRKVLIIKN